MASNWQTRGSWDSNNPLPVISALSPGSGGVGTPVTITGSNFGDNQGTSTVSFGGLAPPVASWSANAITVTVPSGLSPGVVGVQVTVFGVASNSATFTVTQPLLLTPNQMTLVVGETQRLQILNSDGSVAGTANYTVDDTSIAEILDDGNGGFLLSATVAGTTKLHASFADRTGEADVTVIFLAAGESLPAGTVKWAAPTLGDRLVDKIVQSRKVDDSTPDFYVQEQPLAGGAAVIRAFAADGQQLWAWPNDGRAIALAAADNSGGVLAFNAFSTDTQTYLSSVSKSGAQSWRTATPHAITSKYAVHPDGTVFLLEVPAGLNPAPAQVVALDPVTGQPRFSVTLPASSTTTGGIRDNYVNPQTGQSYTICDPLNSTTSPQVGRVGGLVIDGGGLLWLPVVANVTNKSVSCTPQVDSNGNALPWDGSGTSYSYTSTVSLVSVTSAGASSTGQLDTAGGSGTNWNDPMPRFNLRNAIIPDGAGGVLVSVVKPDLSNPIYRSNGVQYTTPLVSVDQMLLGENDTVFAAGNSGGVMALNLQTGASIWQRPEAVSLVAALGDGSLLVEGSPLSRIDGNGASNSFVGDVSTYASSYLGGNWWATSTTSGGLGILASDSASVPAEIIWWMIAPTEHPSTSGNAQKQNSPPTEFPELASVAKDAIYSALDHLISRLSNAACSNAAQTNVFSKLNDANGFNLTTDNFVQYLSQKRPLFYDGTKSSLKYKNLVCGPRNGFLGTVSRAWCLFTQRNVTVQSQMAASGASAMAQTPGFPLLVFFDPADIETAQAGRTEGNEATVFHEALHGVTGLEDDGLQGVLLGPQAVGEPSVNITNYIRDQVLSQCPQ